MLVEVPGLPPISVFRHLVRLPRLLQSYDQNKSSPICHVSTINEMVPKPILGTYIAWGLFAFIVSFCFISGALDYFVIPKDNYFLDNSEHHNSVDSSSKFDIGWRIVECFSFYSNVKRIFKVEGHKEGQIDSLNCIRTMAMCWIISAHALIFCILFASNPLDLMDYGKTWGIQPLVNGYFAVDTFFFISGLLLGFLWFKRLRHDKAKLMTPKTWIMFYVHRFVRISPAYYMAVIFFTFVFTTTLKNMPILAIPEMQQETCRQNWWINLLYLNNYIREDQMCFVISWYLATDMQIYIATPLLLAPFALFGSAVGVSLCLFVIAASTGASMYLTYKLNLPPSSFHYAHQSDMGSVSDYKFYQYYAPYIRAQVYVIGILTGYFLQSSKRLVLPKILILFLYVISAAMMLTVVFGLRDWINGKEITLFDSAMYNAFSRSAWALGLAWIVIASFYGYGGPLGAFLSWWIWTPFGRLSFSAYLTHIPVIIYVWGMDQTQRVFTGLADFVWNQMLPAIVYSFIVAVFWSACFEMPFAKLETLLHDKKSEQTSSMVHPSSERDKVTVEKYYSTLPHVSTTKTSQNWT